MAGESAVFLDIFRGSIYHLSNVAINYICHWAM